MLGPIYTKPFREELKLMQKRGLDVLKLRKVMGMIINEQALPPERHNHPLRGEWEGTLECHIQGDWGVKIRVPADFEPWRFAYGKTPAKGL
jgi:mRNA interferase YafQ